MVVDHARQQITTTAAEAPMQARRDQLDHAPVEVRRDQNDADRLNLTAEAGFLIVDPFAARSSDLAPVFK